MLSYSHFTGDESAALRSRVTLILYVRCFFCCTILGYHDSFSFQFLLWRKLHVSHNLDAQCTQPLSFSDLQPSGESKIVSANSWMCAIDLCCSVGSLAFPEHIWEYGWFGLLPVSGMCCYADWIGTGDAERLHCVGQCAKGNVFPTQMPTPCLLCKLLYRQKMF